MEGVSTRELWAFQSLLIRQKKENAHGRTYTVYNPRQLKIKRIGRELMARTILQ
jgi:hypothetical protein